MNPPIPVDDAMGAGVDMSFLAGVRIGAYPGGGSRILYPSLGSISSNSSSESGAFLSPWPNVIGNAGTGAAETVGWIGVTSPWFPTGVAEVREGA